MSLFRHFLLVLCSVVVATCATVPQQAACGAGGTCSGTTTCCGAGTPSARCFDPFVSKCCIVATEAAVTCPVSSTCCGNANGATCCPAGSTCCAPQNVNLSATLTCCASTATCCNDPLTGTYCCDRGTERCGPIGVGSCVPIQPVSPAPKPPQPHAVLWRTLLPAESPSVADFNATHAVATANGTFLIHKASGSVTTIALGIGWFAATPVTIPGTSQVVVCGGDNGQGLMALDVSVLSATAPVVWKHASVNCRHSPQLVAEGSASVVVAGHVVINASNGQLLWKAGNESTLSAMSNGPFIAEASGLNFTSDECTVTVRDALTGLARLPSFPQRITFRHVFDTPPVAVGDVVVSTAGAAYTFYSGSPVWNVPFASTDRIAGLFGIRAIGAAVFVDVVKQFPIKVVLTARNVATAVVSWTSTPDTWAFGGAWHLGDDLIFISGFPNLLINASTGANISAIALERRTLEVTSRPVLRGSTVYAIIVFPPGAEGFGTVFAADIATGVVRRSWTWNSVLTKLTAGDKLLYVTEHSGAITAIQYLD